MPTLRLAVFLLAIGCSGSAIAQSGDGRGACKADYDKYCAGTLPGGGRVVACLNKQQSQLSDACKKVLASRKKQ
ncbi:cysteine rich repeat-containing protein [Bradyrhizobium sp. CB3481]|uniref:cysteine rich repeat-containing protein n=1 Tax=Bradyrhizobium sp. CB3481 TaxID=3039158 RepID=UPI0024B1115C|nr:cysteine rich repeat-containing protein [Bradyrhizobium sp. CB3481]WFU14065.1 cysteine rich repeat-containing protein [Bradyrhizobium sp. CB3481]